MLPLHIVVFSIPSVSSDCPRVDPISMCVCISQSINAACTLPRILQILRTKDPKQIELERLEQGFSIYVNGANSQGSRQPRRGGQKPESQPPAARATTAAGERHRPPPARGPGALPLWHLLGTAARLRMCLQILSPVPDLRPLQIAECETFISE